MPSVAEEIVVKKVGPIDELHIPIPPEGGVVLCRGRNGLGKSTAIEATKAALGQKVKLEKQRDQVQSGSIETPWGRKVTVGQKVVGSGKLTVSTVDEDFSFADIVEPPEKDPVAADKTTLKAILRAGRAKADVTRFHKLFNNVEDFRRYVDEEAVKTDDVVQMASLVKRGIETAAREEEALYERCKNEFDTLKKSMDGIDMKTEFNLEALKTGYEQAVTDAANSKGARKSYLEACAKTKELTELLANAESASSVSVADVRAELARCEVTANDGATRLREIEEQIAEFQAEQSKWQSELRINSQRKESLQSKLELAENSAREIERLKTELQMAGNVAEVTEEAIQAADSSVETLRQQMTNAELQERNRHKQQEMIARRDAGEEHRKLAETLRAAAKKTESILSEIIAELGTPVRVVMDEKQNPRLVVDHEEWGETFLQKLSTGERVMIATKVAMKGARADGVFTMDQPEWESLDPVNQALVDAELKGSGIVCLAGECDAGELRAEVYA
ncbi:MAG: hypothetical protein E6R04_07035 [Spirochaetes bacterium]|nr:MAG: hypothetical protein E6R04_07035 [Spirochaetota bacterium]